MIAALVSARPYDSSLVDSISCLYMVSSTPLTHKALPSTLPQGSSGCGSLHLLLLVARGRLSDNNCTRHQSVSIPENH